MLPPVPADFLPASSAKPTASSIRRFLTIEMQHRYTVLLIFMAALLSVLPFIKGNDLAIFPIELVFSVLLLFGISAGRRMRRDLIVGSALAIAVIVGRWPSQSSTDIRVALALDGLTVVFLLYIAIMILNQVFSARRVTLDTIAGAACTYFLIGLAGAFVYRAMFMIHPNSFLIASPSFAPIFEGNSRSRPQIMNFVYYSFSALTTAGFGGITAASGPSRAFSLLEAIAGQFFLAVLIARLVSLELIHSTRRDFE